MTSIRRIVEISGTLAALLLAVMAIQAWLAKHDDKLRMQATIAAQKQLLDAADARERDRDGALKDTLAQIESLKRSVQTPARDLPKYLALPQPITMLPSGAPASRGERGTGASDEVPCTTRDACSASSSLSPAPSSRTRSQDSSHGNSVGQTPALPDAPIPAAQIPASDLKPLYDYVQDCRSCQAQLATAKLNAADDAAKLAAITRERDAAITTAKGGTFWRRLRRNALWFAVGAGAGAVALCGTGHCR
ncbi:MAG: hypothetical protein WAN72_18555 [Candidatus Acidiferrales bacterium]